MSYFLWSIPFIRLILPGVISFSSRISLVSIKGDTIPVNISAMDRPAINRGTEGLDNFVNSNLEVAGYSNSTNHLHKAMETFFIIWIIGFSFLFLRIVFNTIRLRKNFE